MAEMATARTRIVTMREDQFVLSKEIARYVRDEISKRMQSEDGALDAFALRRSKERIDELLDVYDGPAREKARQSLGNGGKPPATEVAVTDSAIIVGVGDIPPAAQDEGAKDAAAAA